MFDESHAMAMPPAARASAVTRRRRSRAVQACGCSMRCPMHASSTFRRRAQRPCHNSLAYAQRLGLWGSEDFPLRHAREFIAGDRGWRRCGHGGAGPRSQGAGPLRRLRSCPTRGRPKTSWSSSTAGRSRRTRIRIYDTYSIEGGFQIIHNNHHCPPRSPLYVTTASAARTIPRRSPRPGRPSSPTKQRLLLSSYYSSMKTPTLIAAIQRDAG